MTAPQCGPTAVLGNRGPLRPEPGAKCRSPCSRWGSVVVAVVQIGDVGVGVGEHVVSMRVAVSSGEAVVVMVIVMVVVVGVFVVVG